MSTKTQELTRPTNPKEDKSVGPHWTSDGFFPPKDTETIVVDAATGGMKASKLARFDLIPPEALWSLAEVYGIGCQKYADRNWEKGYRWGLSVAALLRHLFLWIMGKSFDTEGEGATGCHHLSQVAWHAFTLFTFETQRIGTDDRPAKPTTA